MNMNISAFNQRYIFASERGSLTLVTESLLLVVFGVVAFAAMKLVLNRAEDQSVRTRTLMECTNILDCPAIEKKKRAP